MHLMRDAHGQIIDYPEDCFMYYTTPVSTWLSKNVDPDDPHSVYEHGCTGVGARYQKFFTACKLVIEHMGSLKDLRHEPHVVENYTPDETGDGQGELERIFLFKFDNNGTTMRVADP